MKEFRLLYIILLFTMYGYSQKSITETTFWKLTSLSGELNLNGSYWDQKTDRSNFNERLESSFISGGLFLNSNSFFWHPNFLSLDVNAGYSPETGQRLSLVTPDRNEINTLKKLYAKASFFQHNSFNFNVFTNINESYNNRENLTNLRSKFENWGSVLTYTNEYLPFTISYNRGKGEQKELQTDRRYITEQNNFESRATKTFGLNDWHQFIFSHNKYVYEDTFSFSEQNQNSNIIKNNITSWSLNNNLFFDSKKNYSFNSRISNEDQRGDFNFKRFQILENIFFKLPKKFNFAGNYNYYDIQGDIQNSKQHNARGILSHQLYKSLRTRVSFEYNNINNTQYKETFKRTGLNIRYVKKIPLNGQLSLSYRINSNKQNRESEAASLFIQNEEHTISDGQIVLLNNQYSDVNSVIVRDVTNTIIYRLNFDYILIERNEFLEIQRIPGGQIANNATVLIDYGAIQPLSYQFNAINNFFGARISLFKNKIEFYYNISKQDYIDPVNVDFLTLNYFNKNVYGSRFRYDFISGGIEHDNYRSTVIPYRLTRYYLVLQGKIKEKLYYTLNGDFRNYHMIVEEGLKQKYYSVSGNISYNFNPKTKLSLETAYRKQEGEAIDLDLLTARLELTTRFRQLYVTAGFELYENELFNEKMNFKKVTIQISRKF
ncbi:MAG: hypothetical protein L3J20_00250 [Flavobacteriaceae bacterium]|nr:hypothetical protein [Flavobacteriaceae bacterium]